MHNKLVVIGLALLAFVLVVFGSTKLVSYIGQYEKTKTMQKVTDAFVEDLINNNPSDAYSMLSKSAQSSYGKGSMIAQATQFNSLFGSNKPSFGGFTDAPTYAAGAKAASYTIKSGSVDYSVIVAIVQENGNWKVIGFSSNEKT